MSSYLIHLASGKVYNKNNQLKDLNDCIEVILGFRRHDLKYIITEIVHSSNKFKEVLVSRFLEALPNYFFF